MLSKNFSIIILLIFFDLLLSKKNLIRIKNNYFFLGFSLIIIFGLILTLGIYDEKIYLFSILILLNLFVE